MAFDAFLKVTDIPGESTDDRFKDWIQLLTFSHGVTQPVSRTASSVGGASAERANFSDITISKEVDIASAKLYEASFTGKHIKEVTLVACRAGGEKEQYLEIKMEQVLISSYNQGGGGEFPTETVSFSPGKIVMTYNKQQRADGKQAGKVVAGWDLSANKVYA